MNPRKGTTMEPLGKQPNIGALMTRIAFRGTLYDNSICNQEPQGTGLGVSGWSNNRSLTETKNQPFEALMAWLKIVV